MKIKVVGSKINRKLIRDKISKAKTYNDKLMNMAQIKLRKAKGNLLKAYDAHPVTQEIAQGNDSSNKTGTLGGYGNLFSFIGFSANSSPTQDVRNYLNRYITLRAESKARKGLTKNFSIKIPTLRDFNAVAQMPYEQGNNWVHMVERGISNFSYYMHKRSAVSRSGAGIQIKNKIRMEGSQPIGYMSILLRQLEKELKR